MEKEEQFDMALGADNEWEDEDASVDRGDGLDAGDPEPAAEPTTDDATPAADGDAADEQSEELEEEEEVEPESEEPAEEARPKQSNWIPKKRFDQLNERMKAAEARVKELEKQGGKEEPAAPSVDFDFDAKEQEFLEAHADGEFDKAKAIRREIREAERELYRQEAEQAAKRATGRSRAQQEHDAAVSELEEAFDVLNPQSEAFSEELVGEVLELQEMFASKYSPADALRKAALHTMALHGFNAQEEGPTAEAPKVEPKKPDVRKKVEAANKQPPRMPAGEGTGEKKTDPMSMSEQEFDALPESAKARLRGDLV